MRKNLLNDAKLFAAITLFAAGLLVALQQPSSARAEPEARAHPITERTQTQRIRVIDGDTLEDMAADITYRIVNIDTPETGSRARCAAERALGDRATQEARALVRNAQAFTIRPTGRTDRYGRTIAYVVVDGHDFGETLIAQGLARPWRGRREPWCDAAGGLIL